MNNQHSKNLKAWVVWGLGTLFYFYEYLLQVAPGVMSNELMRDFSVTSEALGILSGVYFYSYAFMQMPGGLLLDFFGPRKLLTIATAMCAISTLAFGLTESYNMACLARFLVGFGSAFAVIGTMKLAANWFDAKRFAFFTGLMVTMGMLGAIFGEEPLALLVDTIGWRHSMIYMGAVGLILTICIYVIVKDAPSSQSQSAPDAHEPLFTSLKNLIRNKNLWVVAIFGGLIYTATPVFCGLWGVMFLMTKLHITKPDAANDVSLVFFGWAVAGPLWGHWSSKIMLRKPPLYISTLGVLLTFSAIIYLPIISSPVAKLLLFLFGVFSSGFLPAFAVAKELCNPNYVATGMSFMNMMNMIGVALIQPIIGKILDTLWQGQLIDGVRVYPISAYSIALSILPIGFIIALILLPFVKETHCQSIYEK